jgi:2-polyprenyl-3-methyl-5-hydroxy-6-metoxy-1,4-benzoquinol methylase
MRLYGEERSDEEIRRFVLDYKRDIESDPHNRYVEVRELVPSPGRVLDFGCGWGAFSKMLEERGNEVLGIDLDDNAVEICRLVWGDSERLRFETAAITDLEPASFDSVVSNEVIEHVHNPGNYLHQINRVLVPGGRLVISLPNVMTPRHAVPLLSPRLKTYLKQISDDTRRDYRKEQHHIQAWDPAHFVRLVSSVGFALEDYRPMEGIALPHGRFWPSYVRFRPLRRFSYSMAFSFTRVAESDVAAQD